MKVAQRAVEADASFAFEILAQACLGRKDRTHSQRAAEFARLREQITAEGRRDYQGCDVNGASTWRDFSSGQSQRVTHAVGKAKEISGGLGS